MLRGPPRLTPGVGSGRRRVPPHPAASTRADDAQKQQPVLGQLQLVGGPVRHEKPGPVALDRRFLRQDPKQWLGTEVSLRSPCGAPFQNTHIRSPTTAPAATEPPEKGQDQDSIRTATNNNLPRASPGSPEVENDYWKTGVFNPFSVSLQDGGAEGLLRADPPGGRERHGRARSSLLRPPG